MTQFTCIVLQLFLWQSSCHSGAGGFFPEKIFSTDEARNQAWAEVMSSYYSAAEEPSLSCFAGSEIYRIFYHSGLEPPVLLRLNEVGGQPTRTVVVFATVSPDEPVEVTREPLTPRDWRRARRAFSTIGFWSTLENQVLPVDVITLDGPILIVEACRDGRCRALQRRSCDPGDQLCELAVKLLGDRLPGRSAG